MQTDLSVSAPVRLHKVANVPVSLPGPLLLGWVNNLLDEVSKQSRIPLLPQQNAVGRLAIAACPPRFLVILLD
jgi:hypothetical protein